MSRARLPVHVRWLIRRDFAEVMEIERDNPPAWTEENFLDVLRQRNTIGMVAVAKGSNWPHSAETDPVVGFIIYELHKDWIQVLNLAVAKSCRRSWVGSQIIFELISKKLSSHRRTKITVDVRETNIAAQLFLASLGFLAVRIDRRLFGNRDCYRFEYRLPGTEQESPGLSPNRIALFIDGGNQ